PAPATRRPCSPRTSTRSSPDSAGRCSRSARTASSSSSNTSARPAATLSSCSTWPSPQWTPDPGEPRGTPRRSLRWYGSRVSEPRPLSIAQFAAAFRAFLDAVNSDAAHSPLLSRLTAHLGIDARTAPVLAEEFAPYDHPTLQRALDELLAAPGRTHERIGLAGPNKRFMHNTYSDLLSSPHVTEGAVDWVNVHLAAGEVLACVQSGLFLIRDEDGSPYAVFVSG